MCDTFTEFRKTTGPRLRDPASWPHLAAGGGEFTQLRTLSFADLWRHYLGFIFGELEFIRGILWR